MRSSHCSTVSTWGLNRTRSFFLPKSTVIVIQTISLSIWRFSAYCQIINWWSVAEVERYFLMFGWCRIFFLKGHFLHFLIQCEIVHTIQIHSYMINMHHHMTFSTFLKFSMPIKPLLKQNLIKMWCLRCVSMTTSKNKTRAKCYKPIMCDATLMKFCRFIRNFDYTYSITT